MTSRYIISSLNNLGNRMHFSYSTLLYAVAQKKWTEVKTRRKELTFLSYLSLEYLSKTNSMLGRSCIESLFRSAELQNVLNRSCILLHAVGTKESWSLGSRSSRF